jgi:hypothetical protein
MVILGAVFWTSRAQLDGGLGSVLHGGSGPRKKAGPRLPQPVGAGQRGVLAVNGADPESAVLCFKRDFAWHTPVHAGTRRKKLFYKSLMSIGCQFKVAHRPPRRAPADLAPAGRVFGFKMCPRPRDRAGPPIFPPPRPALRRTLLESGPAHSVSRA